MLGILSRLFNILAILFVLAWLRRRIHFPRASWVWIAFISTAIFIIGWAVGSADTYIIVPGYIDHVESTIAGAAGYWWHGHPLYHSLESADRYSLLYGPFPFLVQALAQCLPGDPILLSKAAGVLAFLSGLSLFFLSLRQLQFEWKRAIVGLSLFCLVCFYFSHKPYWDRPDSLLLMFSCFGVWFTARQNFPPLLKLVALGVISGLAVACKAHAILYFAPLILFLAEARAVELWRLRALIAFGLPFLAMATVWFFLPGVEFQGYRLWIQSAAKHGLEMSILWNNIKWLTPLLLLITISDLRRVYPVTYFGFIATALLIAVAGSKPGAGEHHFLPFIPVSLYLVALVSDEKRLQKRKFFTLSLLTFAIFFYSRSAAQQKELFRYFSTAAEVNAQKDELNKILVIQPKPIAIGYSDSAHYDQTFFSPLLVKAGGRIFTESSALMDMQFSGIEIPAATLNALRHCEVHAFILPKEGEPWSIPNLYYGSNGKRLFDDEWRETFRMRYEKTASFQFYNVYTCRH